MKHMIYKKSIGFVLLTAVLISVFTLGASAIGFREGMSPSNENNPADAGAADSTAAADDNEPLSTETGENGIIGGADNDTAPGGTTGDFDSTDSDTAARDTTNDTTRDTTRDTTDDSGSEGPMESAIDSAADGAADMVDQATDGTNIWGIVIAIVVIVAVGVLIFAFMPRKK